MSYFSKCRHWDVQDARCIPRHTHSLRCLSDIGGKWVLGCHCHSPPCCARRKPTVEHVNCHWVGTDWHAPIVDCICVNCSCKLFTLWTQVFLSSFHLHSPSHPSPWLFRSAHSLQLSTFLDLSPSLQWSFSQLTILWAAPMVIVASRRIAKVLIILNKCCLEC